MSTISVTNLRKSYGSLEILKDISLEVEDGDFLVLVGPSGCGKSTLLSLVAGFEDITSGDIRIDGKSVQGIHPSQRDAAMVFQSYALYPSMSVSENMAFGLEMRGVPKTTREARVRDVAKTLQIDHLLTRRPGQLSGGQRQRVAMGRALVRDPKLFLFDEPLSNLDAKLRVEMRTEIKKLHQRLKTTMIYVTHDQVEAMTLATKIAVLRDGVLQQFGTPDEIYNSPANTFVAGFMGSPAMNMLPARIATPEGRAPAAVLADNADLRVTLPKSVASNGRPVIVGLRPETLFEAKDDLGGDFLQFDCSLDLVEPAGSDTFVVTRIGQTEIVARVRADFRARPGDKVRLAVDPAKINVFDAETGVRIAA